LVLGTAPGKKSLEKVEYYGNKGNRFWRLVSEILGESIPQDFETGKKMLLKHGIALWDVLAECDRNGSSDKNITNEVPNDVNRFLEAHPSIRRIVLGSDNAAAFFYRHVKLSKTIEVVGAKSPSRLNGHYSYDELLVIWRKALTL